MTTPANWPDWRSRDLGVETPAPVIDLAVVERNVHRLQQVCDAAGVQNWPHIKTHKSVVLARLQQQAGAAGITCQKLGEAEVMAAAGLRDILISYNILGADKLRRLVALARTVRLTVSCDSALVAEGLSGAMCDEAAPLRVLVECDTGRQRCGVPDVAGVVALGRSIAALPGLEFAGLLLYPPGGPVAGSRDFVAQVREALAAQGLALAVVSSGGTPNMGRVGEAGETQYRSGTSIFNDRMMLAAGVAGPADCALLIHATVVSAAGPGRLIVDAGSKTLTSDLGQMDGHGLLVDYPEARIHQLAEEHGFVDVSACAQPPVLGEVVRILPNHVCPVVNLFDRIALTRDGQPAGWLQVDARGRVT